MKKPLSRDEYNAIKGTTYYAVRNTSIAIAKLKIELSKALIKILSK